MFFYDLWVESELEYEKKSVWIIIFLCVSDFEFDLILNREEDFYWYFGVG